MKMKHFLSISQRLLTALVAGLLLGFLGDQFAENLLSQQLWLPFLVVPLLLGVIEALRTGVPDRYPMPMLSMLGAGLSTLSAGWLVWLSACIAFWERYSFRSHSYLPCPYDTPCVIPDDLETRVFFFFLFIFPFGLALIAMSALLTMLTMHVFQYMRNK